MHVAQLRVLEFVNSWDLMRGIPVAQLAKVEFVDPWDLVQEIPNGLSHTNDIRGLRSNRGESMRKDKRTGVQNAANVEKASIRLLCNTQVTIQQLYPEENSNTINHEQQLLAAQQEQVENLIKQKNIESNIHNQDIIYYLQSLPETQQSISDNVSVATSELNDVLLENKENQLGVKRHLTDDEYNLEAVLKKSEEGLLVLSSYQKEKRLNNDMRNKLAKLIVSNELSPNINCSITSSRALFLSKKVQKLFPTEEKSVWYIKNKKGESQGRGKIITKYYSTRRQLIKAGLLSLKSTIPVVTAVTENELSDDDIANYEEYLLWLKNNSRPWQKVTTYWSQISKKRVQDLITNSQPCYEYIDQFPALSDPLGYLLLEQDFEILHPEHGLKLYIAWSKLSEFITDRVNFKAKKRLDNVLTPEGTKVAIISLMPHLFPVITIKKGKPRDWRPSRKECKEAFLLHVKTITDLDARLEERTKKLRSFGVTSQPITVIVGPSFDEIHQCFVVINNLRYEVETPLKVFKCGENGCYRQWSLRNSLRKHLVGPNHNFPAWSTIKSTHEHRIDCNNAEIFNECINQINTSNSDILSTEIGAKNYLREITLTDNDSIIKDRSNAFVVKLYNKPSIPRNHIQSIIDDIIFLISGHSSILKEKIVSHLNTLGSETMKDITSILDCLKHSFNHLQNEYQRVKYFKSSTNYIAPIKYCIGNRRVCKDTGSFLVEKVKDVYSYFIPLRQVLQKFFELPDAFTATMHYINSLKDSDSHCSCHRAKRITKLIALRIVRERSNDSNDDQCQEGPPLRINVTPPCEKPGDGKRKIRELMHSDFMWSRVAFNGAQNRRLHDASRGTRDQIQPLGSRIDSYHAPFIIEENPLPPALTLFTTHDHSPDCSCADDWMTTNELYWSEPFS
ncbi:uncharacterized protein [Linepithema humile]|uniref:uncharacterized protein n=1 Tax=Linepithema humile TaxID=83485 RepID=UPI00351E634B